MLRVLLGMVLLLHGLVHLIGFVVPWRLVDLSEEGFVYKTTLLSGSLDLGAVGIQVVGALWLLAAIAFVAAALGLFLRRPWTVRLLAVAASFSLLLTLLDYSVAYAGAYLNLALLAGLLVYTRFPSLRRVRTTIRA
jgi:hypothetical protein